MLKIPDDVSEILFNEVDKVCTTIGARENSSPIRTCVYFLCVFFFFVFFFNPLIIYGSVTHE